MAELDTFREWFEYNIHARQGYLETFAKLPAKELTRDRGASHPTVLRAHERLLWAIFFWTKTPPAVAFERFRPTPETRRGSTRYASGSARSTLTFDSSSPPSRNAS
ncbi:MAG: hypothetical protein WBF81_06325 [Thermoplasmata archaeon]